MSRLNRWIVVAAVLIAVLGSIAVAFGTAPLGTGDETAHLDYAVEVWHGHLPVFERGLQITPGFGSIPPVQWVSQHPPLFYLLLAPVVGPLADGGHWVAAVLAGRTENALLAGLTVLTTVWAVRRVVPSRPTVAAVAAVVTALCGQALIVGGAIYNDLLTLVFTALALGVAASVIRRGATNRLIVLAALVTAGGMLSRLSFATMLVAVVGSFVVAARTPPTLRREVGRRAVGVLAAIVAPGIAAGWFYLRNKRLTGTITGGHPAWSEEYLHRVTRPTGAVVVDPRFWRTIFDVYGFNLSVTSVVPWLLLLVPLLLAVVWLLVARGSTRPGIWIAVMIVAIVLVTTVVELRYVAGGGGPTPRYGLPLLPVLAGPIALGLMAVRLPRAARPVAAVLVGCWILGAGAVAAVSISVAGVPGPHVAVLVTRVAYVALLIVVLAAAALAVRSVLRPERTLDDPAR